MKCKYFCMLGKPPCCIIIFCNKRFFLQMMHAFYFNTGLRVFGLASESTKSSHERQYLNAPKLRASELLRHISGAYFKRNNKIAFCFFGHEYE
jgi:hypothetical protein